MEFVLGKVEERTMSDGFTLLPLETAARFVKKVNSHPVFGEYAPIIKDIQRMTTIDVGNISHRIESAAIEDGALVASIRPLNTSLGNAAKVSDTEFCVSLRGLASNDGTGKVVKEIVTIDIQPTMDPTLMLVYEKPKDFMHTTVEVHDYEEYRQVRRMYHLLGAEMWPWHKGYKELTIEDYTDGIKHHLYGWEECGFLKRAGMCESGPGTFKSADELHLAVREMLDKLSKN